MRLPLTPVLLAVLALLSSCGVPRPSGEGAGGTEAALPRVASVLTVAAPDGPRVRVLREGVWLDDIQLVATPEGVLPADHGDGLAPVSAVTPLIVEADGDASYAALRAVARVGHRGGARALFLLVVDDDDRERAVELALPDDPSAPFAALEDARLDALDVLQRAGPPRPQPDGGPPDAEAPGFQVPDAGVADTSDASVSESPDDTPSPVDHVVVQAQVDGVRVRTARGSFAPGCRSASRGMPLVALRGGPSSDDIRQCLERVLDRTEGEPFVTLHAVGGVTVRRFGVLAEAILALGHRPTIGLPPSEGDARQRK